MVAPAVFAAGVVQAFSLHSQRILDLQRYNRIDHSFTRSVHGNTIGVDAKQTLPGLREVAREMAPGVAATTVNYTIKFLKSVKGIENYFKP